MKIDKNTKFISDTHFYHDNILKYKEDRRNCMKKDGYINHDKWLKNKWNNCISKKDKVIHLGDVTVGKGKVEGLNGEKYLLKGNHDKYENKTYDFKIIENSMFIEGGKEIIYNHKMFKYFIFEYEELRFMCSHFPIMREEELGFDEKYKEVIEALKEVFKKNNCDYNIHGHTHERCIEDDRCINVSVEFIGFKAISLGEIIEKIKNGYYKEIRNKNLGKKM